MVLKDTVFGRANNGGGLAFSFVLLFVQALNNSIEKRYGINFVNLI